ETFRHFGFTHTAEEEQAATQQGMELLKKSPYKDHIGSAQLFLQALNDRSKDIPNLVSPHLGNRVVISVTSTSAVPAAEASASKVTSNLVAALPLGGRIKIEPWDNQLQMLKTKPVGTVAKDEVTPFELTPFFLYLTRQGDNASPEVPGAVAVKSAADTNISDAKP
ncbi:MAG TPA: hypothetical protein VNY24_21535, partial [Candidatus Acidoferrales bacterium]|nr:hypothetical protein [Candidatus Acidoferrales bacterium]